ncbi:hypothetical protein LINPERPRIM_LOCUS15940 [Linum perenne]
MSQSSYSC